VYIWLIGPDGLTEEWLDGWLDGWMDGWLYDERADRGMIGRQTD
jgi:hypothetical protein